MKRVIASFARVFLRKRIVKFDSGKMFLKKVRDIEKDVA